jgi:hypothetical protein
MLQAPIVCRSAAAVIVGGGLGKNICPSAIRKPIFEQRHRRLSPRPLRATHSRQAGRITELFDKYSSNRFLSLAASLSAS